MEAQTDRRAVRRRIRYRIRKRLGGTTARPRLAVFRSDKHIYVQAIDDASGKTLAAASTLDDAPSGGSKGKAGVDGAKLVGGVIAERLKSQGIEAVVFDRGGFRYHGRVRALAEAARTAGLKF
jgi:large subunit ribosomal protein L18